MKEAIGPSPEQMGIQEAWRPEKIKLPSGEIDVFDLKPEREKSAVPVIFIPGWGGTAGMFREDIEAFAQGGRRSLSIDAPRGIGHEIQAPEMPQAQLRKVAALMETLDAKKIERVDAVGNSEGGMVVALAAKLYPNRFRNIVLEQPAGMIGPDYLLRLAAKFPLDIAKSYIDGVRKKELREPKKQAESRGSKPAALPLREMPQAVREVSDMAKTQIHELLRDIRKKGIKISIIHGVDDNVFPMRDVQRMTKADMVNGFFSIKGKHAQWRSKEDRRRYAMLAEHALTAMEKENAI